MTPHTDIGTRMTVRAIEDRDLLRDFLAKDPVGNVYQLGYLDESYAGWCQWWGAFGGQREQLECLLLLYSGLSLPAVVTVGDTRYIKPLLEAMYLSLPDRFYCHLREPHLDAFRELYDTSRLRSAVRMSLSRDAFEPVESQSIVVRLGHRDTAQIVALYEHFPDNLFEPYQLESGLYFGIHRRSGGDLISIAGIHVLSEENDVAVVGNLVTHPKYRRNRLAVRVMGRLLTELFERVSLVGLNVAVGDGAAQRTMQSFNFTKKHSFWEGLVKRAF